MEFIAGLLDMPITIGTYHGEPVTIALWVCILVGFFLGSLSGR